MLSDVHDDDPITSEIIVVCLSLLSNPLGDDPIEHGSASLHMYSQLPNRLFMMHLVPLILLTT